MYDGYCDVVAVTIVTFKLHARGYSHALDTTHTTSHHLTPRTISGQESDGWLHFSGHGPDQGTYCCAVFRCVKYFCSIVL